MWHIPLVQHPNLWQTNHTFRLITVAKLVLQGLIYKAPLNALTVHFDTPPTERSHFPDGRNSYKLCAGWSFISCFPTCVPLYVPTHALFQVPNPLLPPLALCHPIYFVFLHSSLLGRLLACLFVSVYLSFCLWERFCYDQNIRTSNLTELMTRIN